MSGRPKRQRLLMRYAGSAAETSIGSKPIGTELEKKVYVRIGLCQGHEPAGQSHEAITQDHLNPEGMQDTVTEAEIQHFVFAVLSITQMGSTPPARLDGLG